MLTQGKNELPSLMSLVPRFDVAAVVRCAVLLVRVLDDEMQSRGWVEEKRLL